MNELNVEQWPIERLIPYARNPRVNDHAVDQMVAVITEFGFRIPVVAKSTGELVDGHLRLKAAHKLGLQTVPVALADDLSDAQIKAFRLLANRSATWANWDDALLKLELDELNLAEFDLSLTGFSDEDLQALLSDVDPDPDAATERDEDSVPEAPVDPISQLGDVWLLGPHRVMCGDSTRIDSVEKLMSGALADQLITDPPYNVAYVGKTREALKIKNDSMSDESFRQFLRDAFVAADSVMKPGAVFYIWHADSEGYNFRGACKDSGWTVRQCLIWKKQTMVLGWQDYHCKHEPCLYGWKEGAGHLWASDRKQTTVLEFDRPFRSDLHPTMKPVDLIEYQILNNTKGKDVVLDLFGGGGSTLIAAEKTGRVARLMELDPVYVDVIVKRWQQYSGKIALRESDGVAFDSLVASP